MKTAELFRNRRSQAVRLPREFRFEGDHVFIKKSGDAVVLLPATRSWDSLINSLGKFTDDFMRDRRPLNRSAANRPGLTASPSRRAQVR